MKLYKFFRLMSIACMNAAALPLHAAIYKLDDHVNRVTIYSNMPISPVPAKKDEPKPPPAKEADIPLLQTPTPSPGISARPAGSASTDYPRISPTVQKTRNGERLSILIHELQMEETALNDAVAKNAAADIIHRYKSNIEALKREIGNAK